MEHMTVHTLDGKEIKIPISKSQAACPHAHGFEAVQVESWAQDEAEVSCVDCGARMPARLAKALFS